MNNHKSRLRFLSDFFSNDVYLLITKYNDSQNVKEQNELLLILVKCIELMHIPFNNDDTKEMISSLTNIRTYLCQRYEIEVAQDSFARIWSLIQFLMDEGYFKRGAVKDLCSLMCTLTESQYENCKSEKISIKVSAKFKYDFVVANSTKISENLRLRLKFLSGFLNTNVFESIANFLYSLNANQQTNTSFWLVTYIEILHEAFNNNDTDKFIQSLLYIRTNNCQKNTLLTLNSKLNYTRVFVNHMFKVGYFHKGSLDQLTALLSTVSASQYEVFKSKIIPTNIYAKFNNGFTARDISGNTLISSPSTNTMQKLEYISEFLNSDISVLIVNYTYRLHKHQQTGLTFKLVTYIKVLHKAFNNHDIDKLIQSLTYIRADTCQRHTFSSCISIFRQLQSLIKHIIKAGDYKEGSVDKLTTLLVGLSKSQYEISKSEIIPAEISNTFSHEPSADEIFKNVLDSCCTIEIAVRLEEHVKTFKIIKNHRRPLVRFLKQISASNPEWHKHPRIIQGELLKFRGDLLDRYQRNSAYGQFQNVLNSLKVLVKYGLLPQHFEFPNNFASEYEHRKGEKE